VYQTTNNTYDAPRIASFVCIPWGRVCAEYARLALSDTRRRVMRGCAPCDVCFTAFFFFFFLLFFCLGNDEKQFMGLAENKWWLRKGWLQKIIMFY